MLGLLTSDFGYQNRLTLLQHLIECGDVLLGRDYVYGLDNRISNSRSSVSPHQLNVRGCSEVVNKDLGLSESDDEVAATTTRLEPILSPIGSGGSPSSGSESSPSDSESESSSGESAAESAPAPAAQPAERASWSLSNFAPPPAHPPDHADHTAYDAGNELRHALAVVKEKPSPISELSDSETSSPSPGTSRRRRSAANRISTASSDEDTSRSHNTASPVTANAALSTANAPVKRGRPPKPRTPEERPVKKKRGRPPKRQASPAAPESDVEPDPPQHHVLQDTKTHIFRKVFTPKKGDECGGKGGKGGKGKGGKGKGQVTIIEVTAPESGADDEDRRHRERSTERRNEEAIARVSPPQEPESLTRRREAERIANERIQERMSIERPDHRRSDERIPDRPTERTSNDRLPSDRIPNDRLQPDRASSDRFQSDRLSNERSDRTPNDRLPDRTVSDRFQNERTNDRVPDRMSNERGSERMANERLAPERASSDRLPMERIPNDRIPSDRLSNDRISTERTSNDRVPSDRLSSDRVSNNDRLSTDRLTVGMAASGKNERRSSERMPNERLSNEKISIDRLPGDKLERLSGDKLSHERLSADKLSLERLSGEKTSLERIPNDKLTLQRFVYAEADVGSGLKSGRGSERMEEASSNVTERRVRGRILVRVPLSRLRAETLRVLQRGPPRRAPAPRPPTPPNDQAGEVACVTQERAAVGQTPIYYSYFERLPADALSDEERDHKYYLSEAARLRTAAEREQEPLARVMLYLESVLCFVLTGRVLELELDTKRAFTIYRETIEYIKSIHSMPQRFRASPHSTFSSTFSKLDILSLRVQALLYLRMFKMYNREVKEYNKIVQEYQQKPACAESVSPLSPTPSPAGSVGSVGSGASASSGYCSLAHSVPAHAHHALLQLTKYYTFLYVAHDLWEQADALCRLRPNQDLFIAVDRKCGPLTLFSTFRHLVQYVRHAISLLKNAPRE
ncbi:AF4/FMR2 family member lilli isoform X2 [Battus philenor]|uniref:AF4/FMR2 family member lilli isoform X2 n=1 Tax=Battus philenor TaxID=42288 RepID=UPI0035CEF8E5